MTSDTPLNLIIIDLISINYNIIKLNRNFGDLIIKTYNH